jgi:hypothetical protein
MKSGASSAPGKAQSRGGSSGWNEGKNRVKIASAGEGIGEAQYAYASGRSSAVFLFGRMGHWNGDRDCEPAQLTGLSAGGRAPLSFVAASHKCAMPIARSAPAVASATEMARAKRSILTSSHRDIGPLNPCTRGHLRGRRL